MITGPKKRVIGGLKIFYEEKTFSCKILFKNKYQILFLDFIDLQLSDQYQDIDHIDLNNKKIIFSEINSSFFLEKNEAIIFFKDETSYHYDMGCVIYKEDPSDEYKINKILDTWDKNKI